ncbi:MAG: phosphoglycerate mutase family protein [Gammaproteobacteria bacterium]|nr:phosphoglycerate mutase family protein [Gammaproteobacteria bacterium]NNJ95086.1 histidine phosphatase family protein [Halobacteria archaeon]
MARLIAALVRHGEYHQLQDTPSAHQPFPLTDEGERQALAAARELRAAISRNDWDLEPVIDSSRMLRAWQTADIFAGNLAGAASEDLRIDSHDVLAERSVGCAANLTRGQIEAILHDDPRLDPPPDDWKADSHYCLPLQGAESLLEAGQRVAVHLSQSMDALPQSGRDRLKIFVGHGAAFRHAAHHMGVLAFGQLRQLSMFHCQPVLIEYLPNGDWRHIGGDWKVRDQCGGFTD